MYVCVVVVVVVVVGPQYYNKPKIKKRNKLYY